MPINLPKEVAAAVKDAIYLAADNQKYLTMSRTDSNRFINELSSVGQIADILSQYLPRQEIRTYIKDAVLNRYSKEKARNAFPKSIVEPIFDVFGLKTLSVEEQDQVRFVRAVSDSGDVHLIVVALGTYLKWESALRKALLALGAISKSSDVCSSKILLVLSSQGRLITPSDAELFKRSIERCEAYSLIVGEPY